MIKIDLNMPFLGLNGEEIANGQSMADTLAIELYKQWEGFNSAKAMHLAQNLYTNKYLELDDIDYDILFKGIDKKDWYNFVKDQLQNEFKKAKKY